MARDGTQSRTTRSMGAIGSTVTVLIAGAALLAMSRRRARSLEPASHAGSPDEFVETPTPATPIFPIESIETRRRERRGLPRFLKGTIAGITTGIVLGAIAVVLSTIASPDARAALVVGAGLHAPPPTSDGIYVARIIAQDMNPTLVYAEADVALLFEPTPYEPEPAPAPVVKATPLPSDLQDNAALIFAVLAALTLASWGLIMFGLSAHPPVANAGVE